MRRAARIDGNQNEIVEGLRKAGVSVLILSAVGNGCPDICCGSGGHNFLFEVKDPSKPANKRKLTSDQSNFHNSWHGQISVIETYEDAIRIINEKE